MIYKSQTNGCRFKLDDFNRYSWFFETTETLLTIYIFRGSAVVTSNGQKEVMLYQESVVTIPSRVNYKIFFPEPSEVLFIAHHKGAGSELSNRIDHYLKKRGEGVVVLNGSPSLVLKLMEFSKMIDYQLATNRLLEPAEQQVGELVEKSIVQDVEAVLNHLLVPEMYGYSKM